MTLLRGQAFNDALDATLSAYTKADGQRLIVEEKADLIRVVREAGVAGVTMPLY